MSAISVAELLVGVQRSPSRLRARRLSRIDAMLDALPTLNYTSETARLHAGLIADDMKTGRIRGSFDLIVAATAAATPRTLVSTDATADFGSLPGVDVQVLRL